MNDCDLLIIGGGPAGLTAAVYASTEGLATTIVEAGILGGQAATSARIVNYLGFPGGVSGLKLMRAATLQAKHYGTRIVQDKVVALATDGETKLVQLASGKVVACKSILLSMGVQYRKLEVPGAAGFGVFYGHNPAEINHWTNKRIAIVGGANSAGQAAWHFSSVADKVHVLSRSPLAKSMSQYLIDGLKKPNVEVTEGVELANIVGDKLANVVTLTDGSMRVVDGVFLFIGAEPKTSWLPCHMDGKGFILTDDSLETSIPGVFAAGDVRQSTIKRINIAVGEGSRAVNRIHGYLEGKG